MQKNGFAGKISALSLFVSYESNPIINNIRGKNMATISICMIVKNEEAVLARCLESLKGLAEEIVIVDTGSTDATKKIASAYTKNIYDFQWIDDFSAARNFAFSKCTQQYIYTADADEVLDEENRKKWIVLKQNILPEIEIVQMYYVNSTNEKSVYNFQKELRPKLFKRLREFRWIDPIHERVLLQPVVYDSDIEIKHLPQGEHTSRDLAVFAKLIQKGVPLSDTLFVMYARELFKAGKKEDIQNAKQYFLNILQQKALGEKRQMAQCILAKAAREQGDVHSFLKHCVNQIAEGATSEICCELGYYFLQQKEAEEAMSWFENAMAGVSPCMDIACCGEKAMLGIAECFEKMGQTQQSLLWKEKAKQWIPPQSTESF